jgi:hypothetical protein
MKREVHHLLGRAIDSLVLAIEHFNRPHDRGRPEATLILADHANEMLLKAAILHRGGMIRKRGAQNTMGFEACVNACLLDPKINFLEGPEADSLRLVNGLRDGAQHHFIIISEQQLYLSIQAATTLFVDILDRVFGEKLVDHVPQRVLPVSTMPPSTFPEMMDTEVASIRSLIQGGRRQGTEARARLRTLALVDAALRQDPRHPTDAELNEKLRHLKDEEWTQVFPGAAALRFSVDGGGQPISLRLTKTDGIPVRLAKEGDQSATVVAIKKVDTRSYYNISPTELASKVGLTTPKCLAVVKYLKLQDDEDCHKTFLIGKSTFHRYSPRAIERISQALPGLDLSQIWTQYGAYAKPRKTAVRG